MKHALRHCQKIFDDHLIVAYFFNARGETLEKTPLGMLRSIVYQLISKDTTLYDNFVTIFRQKQMVHSGLNYEWRQPELRNFVRSVIELHRLKRLLLLIDALDECEQQDVREVVSFIESLSIIAAQIGVTLRICLSSRHYPTIGIKRGLELTMEMSQKHGDDIEIYIEEKLRISNNEIMREIWNKANGIFMWVVIVVALLNQSYYEGREELMWKILQQVPADLEEMFNTLLNKGNQDKAETMIMLQWVLFSQRLLKPRELFAAVVGSACSIHNDDSIRRRITTSSKGLIEARKGEEGYLQFIHLSVNDFLLRNKRLQRLDPTLAPDPTCASHGRLWRCCWDYIKPLVMSKTRTKHMIDSSKKQPFLAYAARYIFDHADKALANNAIQGQQTAIANWPRRQDDWYHGSSFRSVIELFRNSPDFEDAINSEILYFLIIMNYHNLAKIVITQGVDVNAQYQVVLLTDTKLPRDYASRMSRYQITNKKAHSTDKNVTS